MFFKKKVQPQKKEDNPLSEENFDNFFLQFIVDPKIEDAQRVPYIMKDGTKILLSGKKLIDENLHGREQFMDYLGKTYPYQYPYDEDHLEYRLTDIMYIMDENGKKVKWSSRASSSTNMANLAIFYGCLDYTDNVTPDGIPMVERVAIINPKGRQTELELDER